MTELEKIDLELFKVCYPELLRPVINFGQIRYTNEHGHECDLFRFTYDIEVCFSVLIPEMNRRGWYYTVSYDPSFQCHEAMFWNEDAQDFKATDDNNVAEAVSKAAYAALKGEK